MKFIELGRRDYEKTLNMQIDCLHNRQQKKEEDTLIFVEHSPVITLGRNAKKENVIFSKEYLKTQGLKVVDVNRGGDVTYHGPGQLVGYTIFDLKERKIGIKDFVGKLEQVFIDILNESYNIRASRAEGYTGVWVGNEKIVTIGLAVKRGVTMHGFAINVNTNLFDFNYIVPCGIKDRGVTSIKKEINTEVPIEEIIRLIKIEFSKQFD